MSRLISSLQKQKIIRISTLRNLLKSRYFHKSMNKRQYILLLFLIAILGFLLSLYLTKHHYDLNKGFCDISSTLSCSLVNTSVYSEWFHIPVALFGVLWFLVLFILVALLYQRKRIEGILLLWAVLGIASLIYFIRAEVLLGAVCPYCTVVHVLVMIAFVFSLVLYRKRMA